MSVAVVKPDAGPERLDPTEALDRIPLSQLARKGTGLLRKLVESRRPVTITVHGEPAMVTLPRDLYDQMVAQLQALSASPEDPLTTALAENFDRLVAEMNHPDGSAAVTRALFAEPAEINRSYRPGDTEEPL